MSRQQPTAGVGDAKMPAEGPSERYWDRQDLTRRLRRIEGQARGVQALVARGASCQAIQTQVAAMQGALDSVRRVVEACRVAEAINEGAGPFDADAIRRALRQGIGS